MRIDDSFAFGTAKPRGTGTQKAQKNTNNKFEKAHVENYIFSIRALRRKQVPQALPDLRVAD
jgi:hypothetical protein